MSDYFDRLLVRYTPVGAATAAPVRVRPRLPGPFERVEALRYGPPDPDEPAALIPTAHVPPSAPAATVRHEHDVRTENRTVVRTERARGAQTDPAPVRSAPEPLLRPAAPVPSPVRPAAEQTPRTARRDRAARDTGDAAPRPAAPAARAHTAPVAAVPVAAPVPRRSDAAAVRGAALGPVGRRAQKPAERVVHVQIGRLEVSAAAPPQASDRRPAGRGGRPAPVLTLDDYLSRGERKDRP
ncbi:hypothetical protein QFZ82_007063 [Streptomyces sp. V4I23]|uniref:hypothetical protein n=1 Tax=Streptomyces sp. V4I23 TaxID=3042282 RepID=UPI0027843416|nr:hypothetical protein [Streptomyces sp. V4I23]MDQ1012578.1 hypothetical protein [Streptomyces sp. V4I23]